MNVESNPFALPGNEVIAAKSGAAPASAYTSPTNPRHVTSHPQDFSMSVCQVHSSAIAPMRIDMPWMPSTAKSGRGSGFAISPTRIVTNHHVVADAGLIEVSFPRTGAGTKYAVRVVVDCPSKDIAVLELCDTSTQLTPIAVANCDSMPQAADVYAVGFPLGQPHLKVTQGVYAGAERMPGGGNFLQISAPLCPGNSGGPLVYKNCVVGINSAIIPGQNCVGYSIPSTQLTSVLHDFEYEKKQASAPTTATHFLQRPLLGAIWQNSDANQNEYLGNPDPRGGLYVNYVMPGSLLHGAGLRRGDELRSISVDNKPSMAVNMSGELSVPWAKNPVHVSDVFGRLCEGQKVQLSTFNRGSNKNIAFVYSNKSDPRKVQQVFTPYQKLQWELVGGLVCANLTVNHIQAFMGQNPTLARFLDPSQLYKPSLIISHVSPYSKLGNSHHVAPGMHLVALNGDKVNSVQDMRAWFSRQNRDLKFVQFTVKGFCKSDVVVKVADLLAEQQVLQTRYRYPTSGIMAALQASHAPAAAAGTPPQRVKALLKAAGGRALIGCNARCLCANCKHQGEKANYPCDCNTPLCATCAHGGLERCGGNCQTRKTGRKKKKKVSVLSEASAASLDRVREVMGWSHMTDDEVRAAM